MTAGKLLTFFKRNNIGYRTAKAVQKAQMKNVASRNVLRQAWAQKFMSLLLTGKKVYVIDETSVSRLCFWLSRSHLVGADRSPIGFI